VAAALLCSLRACERT